jgi:hypothetical protein
MYRQITRSNRESKDKKSRRNKNISIAESVLAMDGICQEIVEYTVERQDIGHYFRLSKAVNNQCKNILISDQSFESSLRSRLITSLCVSASRAAQSMGFSSEEKINLLNAFNNIQNNEIKIDQASSRCTIA